MPDCWLLCAAYCLLFVVACHVLPVGASLFVVCRMSYVVDCCVLRWCCLLFGGSCL